MRTCRDLKHALAAAIKAKATAKADLDRQDAAIRKLTAGARQFDLYSADHSGGRWGAHASSRPSAKRRRAALAERVRRHQAASTRFFEANNEVVNLRSAVASRCKRS